MIFLFSLVQAAYLREAYEEDIPGIRLSNRFNLHSPSLIAKLSREIPQTTWLGYLIVRLIGVILPV